MGSVQNSGLTILDHVGSMAHETVSGAVSKQQFLTTGKLTIETDDSGSE